MSLESRICVECQKLRLTMVEKDNEIEKLKLHIQNLTNYLLWSDSYQGTQTGFHDSKFSIDTIKNSTSEQRFYSSDLFFKSCDSLDRHTVLKSKSVQTENVDNLSNENVMKNPEGHQVEKLHDYIYDKDYEMYYSLSTGYYYDKKSGYMYEPQSGTYYKYDYDKKVYEKVSLEEGANGGVYEIEKTNNLVDQVSNLNLNDGSTKSEKFENEIGNQNVLKNENSIAKDENSIDEGSIATESEVTDKAAFKDDSISLGCAKDWQPEEGSKQTVTDLVKQVVEEHTNMSDYIYDESYRMYYSPSTGYFFDSVRNLLYDPTSGTYYFYDSVNQTYEFYCQTSPNTVENENSPTAESNSNKEKLASRKKYWKKKLELSQQNPKSPKSDESQVNDIDEEFSAPEDGEIFSSDEDLDTSISIIKSPVKSPCSKQTSIEDSFPPSIRAIVENSENLQVGSLLLITCSGGIIGRDKTNAVYLPDVCVSKMHANITFNSDFQTYSIEDLGSQNGTFINDKRLSEPKLKSEPHTLNHGDKLSLGSCKLLIHIHEGYDTCDSCEPGQVLAEIASQTEKIPVFISKEEKEKSRREELRRLKKKYGLQASHFEQKRTNVTSQGYEDKAEIRRQAVGSDNPYEKTEEASMNVSMPDTNKGYQMLKKMGWKEGQTLGMDSNSGLTEPIPLRPWSGTAGLGSSDQFSSRLPAEDKKAKKWVKAQERYFQLSLQRDAS